MILFPIEQTVQAHHSKRHKDRLYAKPHKARADLTPDHGRREGRHIPKHGEQKQEGGATRDLGKPDGGESKPCMLLNLSENRPATAANTASSAIIKGRRASAGMGVPSEDVMR